MTFIHKYKCIGCGLHFSVFSWQEDRGKPFCPECGVNTAFIHWLEETDREIFMFIPGESKPYSISGNPIKETP